MQKAIDREFDNQLKQDHLIRKFQTSVKSRKEIEKVIDFGRIKGRSPTSTTDGYPDVNENRFELPIGNKEFLSKYKSSDKAANLYTKGR